MTPKLFIIYLLVAFSLGFGFTFCYFKINKPEPIVIEVENHKDKFQFDSLIADSKTQHLISDKLKKELDFIYPKYDSLILKVQKKGKDEKSNLHNFTTEQFNHWKDSVVRANNTNK